MLSKQARALFRLHIEQRGDIMVDDANREVYRELSRAGLMVAGNSFSRGAGECISLDEARIRTEVRTPGGYLALARFSRLALSLRWFQTSIVQQEATGRDDCVSVVGPSALSDVDVRNANGDVKTSRRLARPAVKLSRLTRLVAVLDGSSLDRAAAARFRQAFDDRMIDAREATRDAVAHRISTGESECLKSSATSSRTELTTSGFFQSTALMSLSALESGSTTSNRSER
jgi:hypothetical protein